MAPTTLNAVVSIGGFSAMLLLGVTFLMIIYRIRHPHVRFGTMPPRALYTLVVVACVIAMVGAAARAWQLSLGR